MRDPVGEASLDRVIDLDAVEDRPGVSVRPWRRLASVRVSVRVLVAFVLLGALSGVVVGRWWEVGRQRDRDASEVSLFLTVAGMESASGGGGRVVIDGTVAIVNGGPGAVEFVGAGKVADVMVWGHQWIAPAKTGWFAVSATITCAEDASTRPLPVELPVVTEDGVQRTVTVQLQMMGSRWYDLVVQDCALAR